MNLMKLEEQLTGIYVRARKRMGGVAPLARRMGTNANCLQVKKCKYGLRSIPFWQAKIMIEAAGMELVIREKDEL